MTKVEEMQARIDKWTILATALIKNGQIDLAKFYINAAKGLKDKMLQIPVSTRNVHVEVMNG